MSTAGTKGVPREERERQILDVAIDEFGARGYAAVSVGAVAVRAGISKPLVYGYFGTKDGLYAACVDRVGDELGSAIEAVLAGSEPTVHMAEATLRAIFTALQEHPHGWNLVFDRTLPPESAAAASARRVVATVGDQAARGVARLLDAQGLDDPLDRAALTEVWASSVTALVNWWLRHPDQTAADMAARSRRILGAITGVR